MSESGDPDRHTRLQSGSAALERKLAAVLEAGIRRHVVREHLISLTAEAACALMDEALARPPAAGSVREIIRDLLLSHPDGRPSGLPYAFRRDVYGVAAAEGREEVMRLLRSAHAEEGAPAQRLPPDLADVPLGRRRSLARSEEPYWLELLALDPDPIVMHNLLRNARLREEDVVRIAALRPVSAATLHEIAGCERWANGLRVRTAIARNPCSPPDLAVKLLGSLPTTVLRDLRRDPDLHPDVDDEVVRELERRS